MFKSKNESDSTTCIQVFNESLIITTESSAIIKNVSDVLQTYGYKIKIFDLDDPDSSQYNPLHYIRDDADVNMINDVEIILECLMNNETDNVFYIKVQECLYAACIFYLYEFEKDATEKNLTNVLNMIGLAGIKWTDTKSELDRIFESIPEDSLAAVRYKNFKQAAGALSQSIVISCIMRLRPFMTPKIADLTSQDKIELDKIGTEKTALFIVNPKENQLSTFFADTINAQLLEISRSSNQWQTAEKILIPTAVMNRLVQMGPISELLPTDSTIPTMYTTAYQAEKELTELIYKDENTGIYRTQQYQKGNVLSLQTTYEEIPILWNQEIKYRPGFNVQNEVVTIPTLFAKISGVKDKNTFAYWNQIKKLHTDETDIIVKIPYITNETANPIKPFVSDFLLDGEILRHKIKAHQLYSYKILRESMQDRLFDVAQQLIDQKIIQGTSRDETNNMILSTALNLDKHIIRMIQSFDFTKRNPKMIYVVTGEAPLSKEDAITAMLLHLMGFDVLFFVPTGYCCVEQYYNLSGLTEHQIGQYMYKLRVPKKI